MTRIERVLAVPMVGAGYYEDLAALQARPIPLSERFTTPGITPGFQAVRQVAEGASVGLLLDNGQVAWGDCVAVSYSGQAGRDPVLRTDQALETIRQVVAPALEGRELTSFRELAAEIDDLPGPDSSEQDVPDPSRRLFLTAPARLLSPARHADDQIDVSAEGIHTAIRYGVSQALLAAIAMQQGLTMAQVIAQEWDLPLPQAAVPLHAQSGHQRRLNADKMIVHRIASLPHGLVDDLAQQVGTDGSNLTRYIRWLGERIARLGGPDYRPTIHLDLYGALGRIHDDQAGRMLGQIYAWERAAQPYTLRLECPVLMDSRQAQIETMRTLREYVHFRKMSVQLVADEWANTLEDIHAFVEAGAADMIQCKMPDLGSLHNAVEAVLTCRAGGVAAFLGGSYAETDLSARAGVHVALATQPDLLMARPGMGVDEAISLAQNEMARTLALIAQK